MGKSGSGLSKNLLQMKFMQKSKEKVEKQAEEEKSKDLINTDLQQSLKAEGNRFIMEPSYSVCEGLVFGRMSFMGMNPEIERIGTEKRSREDEDEEEVDVSRKEMAERYEEINKESPIGHKNKKRKRTKYIRPVDD